MMELIERGTPAKDKVAEFSCIHCKSRFRAKACEGDERFDPRDGNYVVFKCSVCGGAISVSLKCFR